MSILPAQRVPALAMTLLLIAPLAGGCYINASGGRDDGPRGARATPATREAPGRVVHRAEADRPQRQPLVPLPERQHVVASGFLIGWTAPEAGEAIFADAASGRIIEWRTVEAGELVVLRQDPRGLTVLGIEPARAEMVLFFVPEGDARRAGG